MVLRSASPELACQEAWAHLVIHHCLIRIIMELAAGAGIDPDRISFLRVLKHVRRSVIARTATTCGVPEVCLACELQRCTGFSSRS